MKLDQWLMTLLCGAMWEASIANNQSPWWIAALVMFTIFTLAMPWIGRKLDRLSERIRKRIYTRSDRRDR